MGFDDKSINFLSWIGRWKDIRIHIGPIEIGSSSPSHFERRKVSRGNIDYHLNSFKAGRKFVETSVRCIYEKLGYKKISVNDFQRNREAMYYLGVTLHSLQDFFSHSNFIDLNEEDKLKTINAIFYNSEPPDTLRLAYVGPLFFLDDFPHGAFGFGENKDNYNWTRGDKTRFYKIKEIAVFYSRLLVEKILNLSIFTNHPR